MFFFDLIPLVGATIAAVLVGIVTVFADFPVDTIIWTIWAIVYQQVENTVIQPRIQSRAVNVQPFVVLVAVLFGSTLFGIAGALLAIPAAATIQIGLHEYWQYRKEIQAPPRRPAGAPGAGGGSDLTEGPAWGRALKSSGGGTRTHNPSVNSRMLCRLSYPGPSADCATSDWCSLP